MDIFGNLLQKHSLYFGKITERKTGSYANFVCRECLRSGKTSLECAEWSWKTFPKISPGHRKCCLPRVKPLIESPTVKHSAIVTVTLEGEICLFHKYNYHHGSLVARRPNVKPVCIYFSNMKMQLKGYRSSRQITDAHWLARKRPVFSPDFKKKE